MNAVAPLQRNAFSVTTTTTAGTQATRSANGTVVPRIASAADDEHAEQDDQRQQPERGRSPMRWEVLAELVGEAGERAGEVVLAGLDERPGVETDALQHLPAGEDDDPRSRRPAAVRWRPAGDAAAGSGPPAARPAGIADGGVAGEDRQDEQGRRRAASVCRRPA